jgi:hypothetical protein
MATTLIPAVTQLVLGADLEPVPADVDAEQRGPG